MSASSTKLCPRFPASRAALGTGLPEVGLAALPETGLRRIPRWPPAFSHPRPPILGSSSPASTLLAERHSCRSGRTTHENAVFCSAWHTHIAGVEVLVLCLWGCWPFLA